MKKDTNKLDVKDKIDIVEEVVIDTGLDCAIETGLQLIPLVGGALSTAYFSTKQAKQFKRIENFYEKLSSRLTEIEHKVISMEEQYEDGIVSLIEQINNKVENEHQEIKTECYLNYMKNLLTNKVTINNYDNKKIFLDILYKMTVLDIDLLVFLYNSKYLVKNSQFVIVEMINKDNLDKFAIVGAVSRLKSYGLISAIQNSMTIGSGDNSLQEAIAITDYGLELIEFVME